jgi:exosortase A-associated hydrolase 2
VSHTIDPPTEAGMPFYMNTAGGRLFAVHHSPRAVDSSLPAVVCCYPFGQETLRAHRAFRQLAVRLARRGQHTLRFDYHGSGDSSGESGEGNLDRWEMDIEAAAAELKSRACVRALGLVGLRLGAALAATVAARRLDLDHVVLWEPVVSGREYLEEIEISHARLLEDRGLVAERGADGGRTTEVLGFPLTPTMQRGLEGIDLLRLARAPGKRILILEHGERATTRALGHRLGGLGARVDYECVPEAPVWERRDMDQAVIPPRTLERIVGWLSRGTE